MREMKEMGERRACSALLLGLRAFPTVPKRRRFRGDEGEYDIVNQSKFKKIATDQVHVACRVSPYYVSFLTQTTRQQRLTFNFFFLWLNNCKFGIFNVGYKCFLNIIYHL